MTASDPLECLYAGRPKLVLLGGAANHLPPPVDDAPYCPIVVSVDDQGTPVATAGERRLVLEAPPAGVTVVTCLASEIAMAEAFLALWRRAGLEPPEVVPARPDAPGETMRHIAHAIARAALAAQAEACREAVDLDRQIAALRDMLEDARNRWRDCMTALAVGDEGLPVLGYETERVEGTIGAGAGRLSQVLPYPARTCRAVAIHVVRPATGDGAFEARLVALEDDSVLERWPDLPADKAGWLTFDVPGDIPWRYRNVQIEVGWRGAAADAPTLSLAPAAGMERYLLHLDGTPQSGRRLAMRAWTGRPDHGLPGARKGLPGPVHAATLSALPVTEADLHRHVPLVERSLPGGWPWHEVRNGAIMVHPAPVRGPSVVAVPLASTRPVEGVRMTLASPNAVAPPVAFMALVVDGSKLPRLKGSASDPFATLPTVARSAWQVLDPGSAAPLTLRFAPRPGPLQLLLATRAPGGDVSHAHAWFRDIHLVCAV